ncbi:probable LRR receptor-like serine/threonine-protein kinase at C-terminar half [Coccomyxa sp. Obi]|nr:probable LRR receptor-like serine/threonine-protein kinase at C-terminar half [Coccomyxa sp. Obi]
MYPQRWPKLILISTLATVALPSTAHGDTGPGSSVQTGSSESPLTTKTLVGSGGSGLDLLLHSDTLRQTATDQQGIEDFLNKNAAYALTNYPLSTNQLAKANRPLVQVPVAFSPLVVVYKIPGIKDGELRLDDACLSGIYSCNIRYWSDPRIVALNPSVAQRLQREVIKPFADDDSDSTTRLFRQYVGNSSAWSSDCISRVPHSSSESMVWNVLGRNYTIGYTEYASALMSMNADNNVTVPFGMAAMKNMNGSFVAPSMNMSYPFRAGALPDSIASPDWALVNASASGGALAGAMKQLLLTFLAQPFQANISRYGGVPLPQSQVMLEKQQIETLNIIPPSPVQPGDTALPLPTIIGAVVGSTVAAAVLLGGGALCHLRYRRRMEKLRVTESIKAWRGELAKEGLLVQHGDIQYDCVPGSKTKFVVLGEGSFGKVYKANWNGTTVAVKVLSNNSDSQRAAFVREANMLQALCYPNVVSYLGCAITDHNQMMLVLEFMGGGDLAKAMSKERGGPRRFSWHVNGRFILLGIARGMAYIHSKGIIIFDVKAGNVLLDEACITAKITDVGLAKVMAGSNTETLLRGTAVYMAPELFPTAKAAATASARLP